MKPLDDRHGAFISWKIGFGWKLRNAADRRHNVFHFLWTRGLFLIIHGKKVCKTYSTVNYIRLEVRRLICRISVTSVVTNRKERWATKNSNCDILVCFVMDHEPYKLQLIYSLGPLEISHSNKLSHMPPDQYMILQKAHHMLH